MMELREFTTQDIGPLVRILNDPEVTRYLSARIPSPYTEADARWWIEEGCQSGVMRAITKDGVLVGSVGVTRGEYEYRRSGELGYWLAREYWRQGLTLTAVQQLTQLVFSSTDIVRIYALVFSDNRPSMHLLQKAGFQPEAVLRQASYKNGQFFDDHVFSLLKPDE